MRDGDDVLPSMLGDEPLDCARHAFDDRNEAFATGGSLGARACQKRWKSPVGDCRSSS